jgi:hypothetical protein
MITPDCVRYVKPPFFSFMMQLPLRELSSWLSIKITARIEVTGKKRPFSIHIVFILGVGVEVGLG